MNSIDVKYPPTEKHDIKYKAGSIEVNDPYRWLEKDIRQSPEVKSWVEAQGKSAREALDSFSHRDEIRDRLKKLVDYDRYSSPQKVADYYTFFKHSGLDHHPILYRQNTLEDEPEILLNPNEWSSDGKLSLGGISFSHSGDFLAYAVTDSGSDWAIWQVVNVRTGEKLPDELKWIKFSNMAWTHDDRGFFYVRFPEPEKGREYQALNLNSAVYYHNMRSPQDEDVRVWDDPCSPEHGFTPQVTEDGRWLIISIHKGTDPRNKLLIKDLSHPYSMPLRIIDNLDSLWRHVTNEGSIFWFWTDHNAPKGKIVKIDIREEGDITELIQEVVPESQEPIRDAGSVANMLVISYLKDVLPLIRIFRLDGSLVRDVQFPGLGSGSGFIGQRSENEVFYSFSSFNQPQMIYRYDMITGESSLFRKPEVDINPENYVVEQIFYTSSDGEKVPMFIARHKDTEFSDKPPVMLYGYGGFNICLTPAFSAARAVWMDMGGVFAMANIRGGGEYGLNWHNAAKGHNRKRAFEDFIWAARWLTENVCGHGKVAINGGSNGGLLTAASLLIEPGIFGAAIPEVGVLDMLRFHLFTAGRYWKDEYGDPDNPQDAEYLASYSPYHNVKKGVKYPPVLLMTADTDDRVVPAHTFKMAARMQTEAEGGPFILRVESAAGHGAGKSTAKIIDEWTDRLSFLFWALNK